MPPSPSRIEPPPVSRAEWWWLGGAVLLGVILRLSFPGQMAIEHFDEGVYASNFWFGEDEGYEYPARHLYAPPLLPLVIEWTMIIVSLCGFRPTGFVPMIPCLVAGLATIPSMWWVGRRWFGPTAGLITGVGVCLHAFGMWDKHRLEARSATDSASWIVAVYRICWGLLAVVLVLVVLWPR